MGRYRKSALCFGKCRPCDYTTGLAPMAMAAEGISRQQGIDHGHLHGAKEETVGQSIGRPCRLANRSMPRSS